MTMNRRDTIFIAVLINLGLITVLFITAISFENDFASVPEVQEQVVALEEGPLPINPPIEVQPLPTDEVDQVLEAFQAKDKPVELAKVETKQPSKEGHVEITVKRGDSLDRLARANKTTIREIKKVNDLKTDRLRIGQTLKIPLPGPGGEKEEAVEKADSSDTVFYVMEKGDNPWKIAKKFHVSYEQIIELNDLNETKARALKPGDRIRIR